VAPVAFGAAYASSGVALSVTLSLTVSGLSLILEL
jgi:hypothetical protein